MCLLDIDKTGDRTMRLARRMRGTHLRNVDSAGTCKNIGV
jgi:hypothetical protein